MCTGCGALGLGFPQSGFLNLPPPGQPCSVNTGLPHPAPCSNTFFYLLGLAEVVGSWRRCHHGCERISFRGVSFLCCLFNLLDILYRQLKKVLFNEEC